MIQAGQKAGLLGGQERLLELFWKTLWPQFVSRSQANKQVYVWSLASVLVCCV